MHLQHLNNKCSIVIKMMPLVMNICNQGWICWDGGITKVIFCPTCTFLASSYHYIWTSNWFLQISSSEPEKQSKSTKAYAGAGVVWIYHTRSHTHPKEKQPSIMLLSLLSACTQCMKCWIIKFADQNSCDTSKRSVAVAAFSVNSIFLGGSWEQTAKVLGFLWVFSKAQVFTWGSSESTAPQAKRSCWEMLSVPVISRRESTDQIPQLPAFCSGRQAGISQ